MPGHTAAPVRTDPARSDEPAGKFERERGGGLCIRNRPSRFTAIGAHDQAIIARLDPDISAHIGQMPLRSCVHDPAELGWQRRELRRTQSLGKRLCDLPVRIVGI